VQALDAAPRVEQVGGHREREHDGRRAGRMAQRRPQRIPVMIEQRDGRGHRLGGLHDHARAVGAREEPRAHRRLGPLRHEVRARPRRHLAVRGARGLVAQAAVDRRGDLVTLRDRADHRPRLAADVDHEDAQRRLVDAEVAHLVRIREREVVGDQRDGPLRADLAIREQIEVPAGVLRRLARVARGAAHRRVLRDHAQPAPLRVGERRCASESAAPDASVAAMVRSMESTLVTRSKYFDWLGE